MKKIILTTLICSTVLNATHLFGQDGQLDNSFGTSGFVHWNEGGVQSRVHDMIILSNQKIVLSGFAIDPITGKNNFAIARLNTNGTLDSSFDGDGVVLIEFGTVEDHAFSVAECSDGKLLAAGKTEGAFWGAMNSCLVKINIDGSLDNTFGTAGKVIIDFNGSEDLITEIYVQDDGKILTGGSNYLGIDDRDFTLMRFNPDGTLDDTFGTNGKVSTDFSNSDNELLDLCLLEDGSIYAIGRGNSYLLTPFLQMAISKYNPDGTLDPSFDVDGKLLSAWGLLGAVGNTIVVQSDGKILVAGMVKQSSLNLDALIIRLNENGSIDNSFGTSGMVEFPVGPQNESVEEMLITPDNKILATGYLDYSSVYPDVFLAKLSLDGSFDNSFDTDGIVISDFSLTNGDEFFNAISIQEDGKIVAAGYGANSNEFLVARYLNSTIDISAISESMIRAFTLGPIPVKDHLFINYATTEIPNTITMYSANGNIVKQIENINQTTSIDVSDLENGVYILQVQIADKTESAKFIKL